MCTKASGEWVVLNVTIGIIVWLASSGPLSAQKVQILHADSLEKHMELPIYNDWYFHAGDLTQPATNTHHWDTISSPAFGERNAPKGWKGLGWFGLWIKADDKAVNKKLAFRLNHDGASEIFLDGKPIGGFGKAGPSAPEMRSARMPHSLVGFWLNDTMPHLLSIRYSYFNGVYPDFLGFEPFIGDYAQMDSAFQDNRTPLLTFLPMSAAAMFIIAALHFFLFFFYPSKKPNLYFAVFTILLGIITLSTYVFTETTSPASQYNSEFISDISKVLLMWIGGAMLYSIGFGHFAKWKKWAAAIVCTGYILRYLVRYFWYETADFNDRFDWVFALFFCDAAWRIFQALSRKQRGTWLIATGMLVVMFVCLFNWMDFFHIWSARQNALRLFTLSLGELAFPICMSIYLASDFAQTNKALAHRLKEVETLSAQALAQETEKRASIETEAKRLEAMVQERTVALQRLFTNITHEFKTPLTLIENPTEHLLSKSRDTFVLYHAGLIKRNAGRLSQLVNQLLDLNRIDNGLMDVVKAPIEIVEMLRDMLQTYEPIATQKGIRIDFHPQMDLLWVLADRDKLEKIIGNIVFNAIKFTPQGSVEVKLRQTTDAFVIAVKDTGIGIPADKLPYVFERFYQTDLSDTRNAEGSGIGLALARELVQLLDGQITVSSEVGMFTEFSVKLPFLAALPQPIEDKSADTQVISMVAGKQGFLETDILDGIDKTRILIIEDNDELREFIAGSLYSQYRVLQAADGAGGVRMALEHVPDLVITDIMMPGMDGYEVCSLLKSDSKTCHIPIIMLTAKADLDSRIRGIQSGAEGYLGKPFAQRELLALLDNLMRTRRVLQEKYNKSGFNVKVPEDMPSIDGQFLDSVRQAILHHLDDASFGTEQLAAELGFSRTQLHRKLKGLIDRSPGDLIRTIRLEHAHALLRQRSATVSEVAYKVGFAEPASFSRSFSRHFGFPPSEVS